MYSCYNNGHPCVGSHGETQGVRVANPNPTPTSPARSPCLATNGVFLRALLCLLPRLSFMPKLQKPMLIILGISKKGCVIGAYIAELDFAAEDDPIISVAIDFMIINTAKTFDRIICYQPNPTLYSRKPTERTLWQQRQRFYFYISDTHCMAPKKKNINPKSTNTLAT